MPATRNNGKKNNLTGPPLTAGYRPTSASPKWAFDWPNWGGFSLGIVDQMRRDPQVTLCLSYKQSPLFMAEFDVTAEGNPQLETFVRDNLERFWRKSLGVALESYAYGYIGAEALYQIKNGLVHFDALKPIHPDDVTPYTVQGELVFVRVRRVMEMEEGNSVDLEAAGPSRPAKGFWLAHDAKYSQWYGRPALLAAWWPWRLKTMADGANEILFKWMYKHAYSGMVVRHPDVTYQDAPGGPFIAAKDYAGEVAEKSKTGANFALSSIRDDKGNYQWDIASYGKIEGNADGLISYINFLDKQIQRGILIPDEVITHEGSTGGYSRSKVAAMAFLISSEQSLNHILESIEDQIIRPLVNLNFGGGEYRIKPKPLIPPEQQTEEHAFDTEGQPGMMGAEALGGLLGKSPRSSSQSQFSMNDRLRFGKEQWGPYQGPQGGQGWRNVSTGEIRYQAEKPKEPETEPVDVPANVRKPPLKDQLKEAIRKTGTTAAHKVIEHVFDVAELVKKSPRNFAWAIQDPPAAVRRVSEIATQKYQDLENRYGRKAALAMIGAYIGLNAVWVYSPAIGAVLVPEPMAMVIGLAEGIRRIHEAVAQPSARFAQESLDAREVAEDLHRFFDDLLKASAEPAMMRDDQGLQEAVERILAEESNGTTQLSHGLENAVFYVRFRQELRQLLDDDDDNMIVLPDEDTVSRMSTAEDHRKIQEIEEVPSDLPVLELPLESPSAEKFIDFTFSDANRARPITNRNKRRKRRNFVFPADLRLSPEFVDHILNPETKEKI